MDWKYFTKQPGIKNLPLFEQKRRFLAEIEAAETDARMTNGQMFATNPRGAAGGYDVPTIEMTPEIELVDESGNALETESGLLLILEQS